MSKLRKYMYLIPDSKLTQGMVSRFHIRVLLKNALPGNDIDAGERDADKRAQIVRQKQSACPKKSAEINREIDTLFERVPAYRKREDLDAVRTDMLFCFFAYGFTPIEYFSFSLEGKPRKAREAYLSDRQRVIYRLKMNHTLMSWLFEDKMKTYERYHDYFRREAIAIERPEDFDKFRDYVRRHPVFVKKEVTLSLGQSVALIDSRKQGMSEKALFDELIRRGKTILEERIVQSEALAAFNESSVNTVRVVSFYTRSGIVVPFCTLRTGRPGAFVDNGGAGGIQAGIDYETGVIYSDGFDELGGVYETHPAKGTRFKGYRLPQWDALRKMIVELARSVPKIKYIGWDMAHTDEGWVMVEGNECCQVIAKQMIDGRGVREDFENLMRDMDLVTP